MQNKENAFFALSHLATEVITFKRLKFFASEFVDVYKIPITLARHISSMSLVALLHRMSSDEF